MRPTSPFSGYLIGFSRRERNFRQWRFFQNGFSNLKFPERDGRIIPLEIFTVGQKGPAGVEDFGQMMSSFIKNVF